MPARGKHRRVQRTLLARRVAAVGTGGAALALPLFGAAPAGAVVPQAVPAAVTALPAAAPAAVQAVKGVTTHSVAAGESLSGIAGKHDLEGGWKRLYKDNRNVIGNDPAAIRPGLKLTIGSTNPAKSAAVAVQDRAEAGARADRSAVRTAPAAASYPDTLDGWIRESLSVMARHGIPGTYEGIHRNVMRESSGNPLAINGWDSNAVAGTPSKGLLQVIDPTFRAYHVPGTSTDSFDPVANITAACNYAADRYGSIDNVFGAY
ncbi:transglycosylase SLT domain-containing protein [Streptomyces sp. NPDC097619]|uniref:transglycosylase SLT domain-containing protein n=1 Tax=Streptomyces sp. NPDC097619 TaxID=3157228 RepID=UPI0033330DF0